MFSNSLFTVTVSFNDAILVTDSDVQVLQAKND